MSQSTTRLPARLRKPLILASAFALSLPARAATAPCVSGDTSLYCRLHGVLSLLSIAAILLGTILVMALAAAVWYYRRNRNKDLLPR